MRTEECSSDRICLQGVALVVDAEVTSYLMMGALSPALKRHSVTLFEGVRCSWPLLCTPGLLHVHGTSLIVVASMQESRLLPQLI